MSTKTATNVILAVILLVGGYLRLSGLSDVSLTNDELSALNRTNYESYATMLSEGVAEIDYHPAGVQSFEYFWVKLFGASTFALRLPFAVFGILSIWMIFRIGRFWSGDRTGLIAAALLAGLAFPILYGRLARPYAPALFFLLTCAYFWSRTIKSTELERKNLLLFIVFGILTAWSHYYAAVMVAIMGVYGIFYFSGKRLLYYIGSGMLMLLIAAIHWPITRAQLNNEGIGGPSGWLDAPDEDWLMQFFYYGFNGEVFFWIVVCAAAIGTWFMVEKKASWRPVILFTLMAGTHYLFGNYYSHNVQPILQYSGMLFSFPFLLLAIAYLVEKVRIPTVIVLPLLVLFGCVFTSLKFADPTGSEQFGKFKELAGSMDEWHQRFDDDITFASNVNDPFYLDYYLKTDISFNVSRIKEREELVGLSETLERSTTGHFAFAWSTIQMPAVVYPLILEYYPYMLEDKRYFNSQVTLFGKQPTSEPVNPASIEIPIEIELPKKDSSDIHLLENEFSPSAVLTGQELREFSGSQFPFVVFKVELRAPPGSNPVLVHEWYRKGKSYHWRGSELNEFYESGTWKTLLSAEQLPRDVWMDDELKLYIWNRGPGRLEIRDITLHVQEER